MTQDEATKRAKELLEIFKDVDIEKVTPLNMKGLELRFGGRCQHHPLNILPCGECLREWIGSKKDKTP